jgi:hypothetical protein
MRGSELRLAAKLAIAIALIVGLTIFAIAPNPPKDAGLSTDAGDFGSAKEYPVPGADPYGDGG